MSARPFGSLSARVRKIAIVLIVMATLAATMLQTAPSVQAVGTCNNKPDVFPVNQLQRGMTGTGYTVIRGHTPTSFDVKFLGVLDNGIYPGVDFILAKITGPQSFLNKTGGIVAGMSGSPIYINNKLVGSASYGFDASGDSQQLMGVTPAEDMIQLFDYPETSSSMQPAEKVRLSDSMRRTAARQRHHHGVDLAFGSSTDASSCRRRSERQALRSLQPHPSQARSAGPSIQERERIRSDDSSQLATRTR